MIRLSQVQIFLLPVQLDLPRVLDHALRPRQPPRHPLRRVTVQNVDRGAEQPAVGLIVGGGQGDRGFPPEGDEGGVCGWLFSGFVRLLRRFLGIKSKFCHLQSA